MRTWILPAIAFLLLCGCAGSNSGTIYQTSTIRALSEGVFLGDISVGEVLTHGDFGLGTFRELDGEMVVFNGHAYQVRSDGSVSEADPNGMTPFAAVVQFRKDAAIEFGTTRDLEQLQQRLDTLRRSANVPCAIRITGQFKSIQTRSVPPQKKQGTKLTDAVKEQATFDLEDVDGTMVGFWFPAGMSAINVPGYHFHFITDDRKKGGHVLNCTPAQVRVELMEADQLQLRFPADNEFRSAKLGDATDATMKGIEN